MGDKTHISWSDATWNFLAGCSKVSPLCDNCYAIRDAHRMKSNPNEKIRKKYAETTTQDGKNWTGLVKFYEPALYLPLRWTRTRKVFVNSMSDWAHKEVLTEWQDKMFAVMSIASQHFYQLLTKRPKNALAYLSDKFLLERIDNSIVEFLKDKTCPLSKERRRTLDSQISAWSIISHVPMRHVWVGFSIGDQRTADNWRETIREIASLGWLTWISYEPAISPVDWSGYEFIKWLVIGGESGNEARPSHPHWFCKSRDWAIENKIPFHLKQWGEWKPVSQMTDDEIDACYYPISSERPDELTRPRKFQSIVLQSDGSQSHSFNEGAMQMFRVGKKRAYRLLDGREWNEFPL